jgi:hypothetical protein
MSIYLHPQTPKDKAHTQPHEEMPEHHSTDKQPKTKEEKIDAQMADSFPASDPPSFSGGNHIIGAPSGRESDSPSSDHPAVVDAEKKAREKSAKH